MRSAVLFVVLAAGYTVQLASPAAQKSPVTLDGTIIVEKDSGSVLQVQGGHVRLSGADDSIAQTIRDERISGKHLRVSGEYRKDGSFQVSDLFVVHPDGLYRIIYFCDVCHITSFKPGNCVCCQQPTKMQEVPLTDPRVYREDVKEPTR